MKKIIDEALKDIHSWTKLFPDTKDRLIRYWIGHAYRSGYQAGLEYSIELRKKLNKKYANL